MKEKIKPFINVSLWRFDFGIGWYKGMEKVLLKVNVLEFVGKYVEIFSVQVAKFIISIGFDFS